MSVMKTNANKYIKKIIFVCIVGIFLSNKLLFGMGVAEAHIM